MTILGADAGFFRQEIWRKKAHVFRAAIDVGCYDLSATTICRLTGQDLVESRMIDSNDYSLQLGPFDFLENPRKSPGLEFLPANQMLMVQCVEQHLEEVDTLLTRHFQFLPRWQVDDVMASLGYSGVSCGPHFDHYDVFLIQYRGKKEWQLDEGGHDDVELRTDTDIRVLAQFEPREIINLAEGDVLYVPPGIGHWGICGGESITLSVGIRNPTLSEFLADFSEFLLLDHASSGALHQALHQPDSGITVSDIEPLHNQVLALLSAKSGLIEWYGTYVTRLREPDLVPPDASSGDDSSHDDSTTTLASTMSLRVSLPSRLSYALLEDTAYLFANGESYPLPAENLDWICRLVKSRALEMNRADLPEAAGPLIDQLLVEGVLIAT